jgi:hypothetical protein
VYEKVQMTGFTIQETIISGLYLYEARKVLRPGQAFHKRRVNRAIKHLIWVNIIIICLDAALLTTEFLGLFSIQTVFKAAIYSVKLKFEFFVLNQLMSIVGAKAGVFSLSEGNTSGRNDTSHSAHVHQLGNLSTHSRRHPRDNYSAFASSGRRSALDDRKMKGVLRTTEVHVQRVSEQGDDIDEIEIGRAVGEPEEHRGTLAQRSDGHSPSTSSEIEFAAKGAYPS